MRGRNIKAPTRSSMGEALLILGRIAVTEFALKQRLRKKGYPEQDITETIARLKEMRYLNDSDYALNWVERRLDTKPSGRLVLRYELIQKGVAPSVADEAIAGFMTPGREMDYANAAADKWMRRRRSARDNFSAKESASLARHLQSRGFAGHVIGDIINRLISEDATDNGR